LAFCHFIEGRQRGPIFAMKFGFAPWLRVDRLHPSGAKLS
jgi:hypothetical protein